MNELSQIFDGFLYCGKQQRNGYKEPSNIYFKNPGSLPDAIEVDQVFIFLHPRPNDIDKIAIIILPTRLKELGYEVLQAPDNKGNGFIFLDEGGPLYSIRGQRGETEILITHEINGYLLHHPWPWDRNVWEAANYLVEFRRVHNKAES